MIDTPCVEWPGGRNNYGYGQKWVGGTVNKVLLTHRLAWMFVHGRPIPDGMVVLHACDNPPCMNPAHLQLGTKKDNSQDAAAKRRFPWQQRDWCGKGHPYTGRVHRGKRICVTCEAEAARRYLAKKGAPSDVR